MFRLLVLLTLSTTLSCSREEPLQYGDDTSLEPPPGSLLAEPTQPFPERFSSVGLYPFAPDFSRVTPEGRNVSL